MILSDSVCGENIVTVTAVTGHLTCHPSERHYQRAPTMQVHSFMQVVACKSILWTSFDHIFRERHRILFGAQNEGAKTYLRRSSFLRHRHHCLHPAANHVSGSRHTLDSIKVSISTLGQTSQSSVDMKDNTNVSASTC